MADVTINDLSSQVPTTNDLFPFATLVSPSTYKASLAQIKTALAIPAAQVNSDWNAASGLAQILNKPTIPVTGGCRVYVNDNARGGRYPNPALPVTATWTVPTGVTQVFVVAVAGGGGTNIVNVGSGTDGGPTSVTYGGTTVSATGGGGNGYNANYNAPGGTPSANALVKFTGYSSAIQGPNTGGQSGLPWFYSTSSANQNYGDTQMGNNRGGGGGAFMHIFNVTGGQTMSISVGGGGSNSFDGNGGRGGIVFLYYS
jgi:hypothetical protein